MNKLTLISLLVILFSAKSFSQNLIGKSVANLSLKDANDKICNIPFLGEKVIAIFYNDPDVKDINEPLSEAIKSHKFPREKYQGIGISNSKDTWLPNSVIRFVAREKQKKYPNSVILIDENHLLSKEWSLDNSDNKGYFLIIGKDKKVKYIRLITSQEESKSIIKEVVQLIEKEIN
jgi:uncharacterized protein